MSGSTAELAGALTEESVRAGALFAAMASVSIIGMNFRRDACTLIADHHREGE